MEGTERWCMAGITHEWDDPPETHHCHLEPGHRGPHDCISLEEQHHE
jgi:hypothetical protein